MSRRGGPLHRLLSWIAALLVLFLILAGAWAAYWFLGPYQNFQSAVFVEIDHGMTSRSIAKELARDGVVRSEYGFLLVRLLHPYATLQAGEYRFATAQTPFQAFSKIRRGDIFYEEFTVPEGSNLFDIANLLRSSDTVQPDDFLKAAGDPTSIRDLDASAPDLEGYLFPSTYRVTHKTNGADLCRAMTAEFRKQIAAHFAGLSAADLHKVVTLASLVEKETAIPGERPLIAGVFENRLKADMPLQCDPTSVYAAELEKRYTGVIHKSDLANANPYNTYAHPGLPPGPICNPSVESLQAAATPADTTYLYFVAKPDASHSHQFSSSLDEHEKAVLAYRKSRER